ncbi:YceI family protein [Candidatus Oscillochloris fontis]|uniref:YceI family protein n=1 Tax=Candidatus Oscillochloris fontis TaxID=2496868 RepID=UPI001EE82AD2|nr:YceI family protein [Candidatus Oscillochloris fontis]
MNRNTMIGIAAGVLVVVIALGVWLYTSVQGETQPASGPITAIPLATSAPTSPPAGATMAPVTNPTSAPTTGDLLRFQIVQSESTATFTIDEVLNGNPFTVVGTTDQVAGEIAVNPTDLSTAQIGTITVNARTLVTDSERRDRAIKNAILNTDTYEFISFAPTTITGLSGSGTPGTPYTFQINGNLTIRDKTVPVVFTATIMAESPNRMSGTATATVNRADFGLTIPSVPMVASVSEQVTIAINLVATAP